MSFDIVASLQEIGLRAWFEREKKSWSQAFLNAALCSVEKLGMTERASMLIQIIVDDYAYQYYLIRWDMFECVCIVYKDMWP